MAAIEPTKVDLGVTFGPAGSAMQAQWPLIGIELPCLNGVGREQIFSDMTPVPDVAGVKLCRRGGLLVGHAREPFVEASVEADARRVYERVLEATGRRHLYRMWNYVPRINDHTGGLEHYRSFCKGRSLAFEAAFGAGFERVLSSASAVGSDGRTLEVIFAAGDALPQHVENPEQVPAYLYPPEHGPRPPSFSRATVVTEAGLKWVFVSGTASIKGHATVGVGSLREQIDCTVDNLRLISRTSGVGENLGANPSGGGAKPTRHFKVYLRRGVDLAEAKAALEGVLVFPGDRVSWLRSDICRAELDIEIEATLVG